MPSHRRPRSLAARLRRVERELAALKAAPPVYVPYIVPQPSMYWQPWQVPAYPANPTPFQLTSYPPTIISSGATVTVAPNATGTTATINPILFNNCND